MFPRYFVPRPGAPEPAPPARGPLLLHVVDAFRLGGPGRSGRELTVVVDRGGALHLVPPADLPPALQARLHHHELASGRGTRLLDVEELWLLSVALLEQPGDAPGLNDPVYLYGRLTGPLPSPDPVAVDGQLALTRADLLDGWIRGAPDALRLPTDPAGRCLHACLPADRAEAVEQGRAVVLAYSLVPPELDPTDASNELLVAQLVHDLLVAVRTDAGALGIATPLATTPIPVPSRADLERDLVRDGWEIDGDAAVRRSPGARGLGGLLSQVFGAAGAHRVPLPPEGTVDDLLALAARVLPAFAGFPDRRALALRARILQGAPSGPPPASVPRIPRGRPPDPAPPPAPASDDWMDDFVREHPSPRLTRPKTSPSPARKRPDWMNDFEDG